MHVLRAGVSERIGAPGMKRPMWLEQISACFFHAIKVKIVGRRAAPRRASPDRLW